MKFTKKVLKNGLRIVTVPMKDNPAVTVLVMVEAGSKYETKEVNGISHFLEHMVFKGTPRRPKASEISREFDSIGAQSNAFTSDEYTGYYAKVAPHHLDTALDIISDMYLNPLFEESEITKEKGVIVEEIRMYKDMPQRQVHDVLGELLYGDQPAGWTVLGPEDNIRSFTRENFIAYREKHYVAKGTVIVVAGDIKEKEVVRKVEKLFATISTKPKQSKLPVKETQQKPAIKLGQKKTDQTHLAIALRTFSLNDKRMPIMRVLAAILGKGMSSRLFVKMREELGICYYVRANHNTYTDSGALVISAGVDTTRVELGIQTILSELKRMCDESVFPEELKKAKDFIAGNMMLNLETSDSQADYVADQELLKKKIRLPDESIKLVRKVTAKEIQKLAQEFFVDKGLNMAIVGPYEDTKRFEKILTFGGAAK